MYWLHIIIGEQYSINILLLPFFCSHHSVLAHLLFITRTCKYDTKLLKRKNLRSDHLCGNFKSLSIRNLRFYTFVIYFNASWNASWKNVNGERDDECD